MATASRWRAPPVLPAAPETVAVCMAALAKGDGDRKPLARASIDQPLSAVIVRHHSIASTQWSLVPGGNQQHEGQNRDQAPGTAPAGR